MDGSEKITPLVIGKSAKPRSLSEEDLTFDDCVLVDTDIAVWGALSDAEIVALDHNNTESDEDESEELTPEPPVKRIIPRIRTLKENSRKRTKMPTEQEAKPAVVTPSLQQWRSPSTFRGAPGEDPLKWLKEYDRVANFNK
ncbi:hypothetical protein TNCV_4892421 [Trichonephila clavipes]|nr:hypothetical protein TNCV_4892421 [Trichonephila clavipes]